MIRETLERLLCRVIKSLTRWLRHLVVGDEPEWSQSPRRRRCIVLPEEQHTFPDLLPAPDDGDGMPCFLLKKRGPS